MPDTITAPAPTTNAPAPAPDKTPSTPPVATNPTQVPTLEQKPETIDPFDELDRRWKEKTGKSIGEEEDKTKTEGEEAPKEPDAEAPKPEEKPAQEPKAEKKVVEPKALRQQLEKTSTELKAAREQQAALQKRLEEAEARSKDTTVVSEQLAAKDKEIESLRADLRSAKQEMDPEFKEKYDKPFAEAAEYATEQIKQLFVLDPETGEPQRNGTFEDLQALYNMPMGKMIAEAKKLFGDATGIVIDQISGLRRMDTARQKALALEKVKWADRAKQEEAQRVQQREAFEAASIKVDKDIRDKHPEWFGEDPNDPEGTKLLKDGYALVDSKPRTFQEAVILRAQIRARAAAFGRIAMENAALKKQIEEMKGKVQSMKETEPGPVKRSSGSEPPKPKDWKDELRTTLAS